MLKVTYLFLFFALVQIGLQSSAFAEVGTCNFEDDFRFFEKVSGCKEGDTVHYSGYHNRNLFISTYCDLNGKILQFEEVQPSDGRKRHEVICNFQKKIIRGQ